MSGTERQDRTRDDGDRRTLTPALRGQRAIAALGPLCSPAAPRLEVDATNLKRADAFTGVVVREVVRRHLDADPGHQIFLREPHDSPTWDMLSDLVGTLPRRARWAGDQRAARREQQVLLPTTSIDDEEVAKLISKSWLPAIMANLRLPAAERRLLMSAAAAFADNGLRYGSGAATLLCACHDEQANDLQLVALSSWEAPAEDFDAVDMLREALAKSRRAIGGIAMLIDQAKRRNIDATIRLAVDQGRLHCRGQATPRIEGDAPPIPAFVASLEIHLPAQS